MYTVKLSAKIDTAEQDYQLAHALIRWPGANCMPSQALVGGVTVYWDGCELFGCIPCMSGHRVAQCMQVHKGSCARKGSPYLLHLCVRGVSKHRVACYMPPAYLHTYICPVLCIQCIQDIYAPCPLTRLTTNSTPLKYTMVMVPLPPFPMLLSTASREGRGRKDPSSNAAILCVGGSG